MYAWLCFYASVRESIESIVSPDKIKIALGVYCRRHAGRSLLLFSRVVGLRFVDSCSFAACVVFPTSRKCFESKIYRSNLCCLCKQAAYFTRPDASSPLPSKEYLQWTCWSNSPVAQGWMLRPSSACLSTASTGIEQRRS